MITVRARVVLGVLCLGPVLTACTDHFSLDRKVAILGRAAELHVAGHPDGARDLLDGYNATWAPRWGRHIELVPDLVEVARRGASYSPRQRLELFPALLKQRP